MLSSALSSLDQHEADVYGGDRPARGTGSGRGGRRKGRGSGGGGGGGGGGPGEDQRSVNISRKLSYLLRHGAKKEGVPMDEGGWVRVDDLFKWKTLRSMQVTFAELRTVVETNAKRRYEMELIPPSSSSSSSPPPPLASTAASSSASHPDFETSDAPSLSSLSLGAPSAPDPDSPSSYRIRATQGHSIATVESSSLLVPLEPTAASTPRYVVHGTTPTAWTAIQASGGLSRMGRGHVHFATGTGDGDSDAAARRLMAGGGGGEVEATDSVSRQTHGVETAGKDEGPDGARPVISGMRASSSVLIWVDVRASAEQGGLKWWQSTNGVVLTEGNDTGRVPLEFVALVEGRHRGKSERKVLWPISLAGA